MWKRDNEPAPGAAPPAAPSSYAAAPRSNPEPAPPTRAPEASSGRAVIGAGTILHGEVAGEEDMLVEGRVEGKIDLRKHSITIGPKGRVAAEVRASSIIVEGELEGNLIADEQIVVRRSGRVRGDLVAPRITIEDGAHFKGSIDMEPKGPVTPVAAQSSPSAALTKPAPPAPAVPAPVAKVGGDS